AAVAALEPDRLPPGVPALLAALSGDLRIVVVPSVPYPRIIAALGLKPAVAGQAALDLSPLLADREAIELPATEGPKRWQFTMPTGPVFLTQAADRLIITTALEADAGLAAALPTPDADTDTDDLAAGPVHHLQIRADLPAVWSQSTGYLPMLAMAGVPGEQLATVMGAAPHIAQHLPQWELGWTSTDDGFVVNERGLPLWTLQATIGAGMFTVLADPERARDDIAGIVDIARLATKHEAALAALRPLAAATTTNQDQLIDRNAALAAAGIDPNALRAAVPALATWDGASPFGHLHSTADGRVRLQGHEPHSLLPERRRSRRQRGNDARAQDFAWTIPVAEGFVIHIFPNGRGYLLEAAHYQFTEPLHEADGF
ncbi:MAG: hypothetical protein PF961_04070, partial [Planctomycetota bacterium]|nr:hypothetical protein [Planctomycetota bacterium]